ncbi:hypothetical protein P154DRAFT_583007 [Amniculicola lignicola CBS 123094]|uniref:Uncharacterized protein n=1 Tax=Amniculicola lignicola CBS 123094 TaxID=1392246 RepID=A0A6A5VUM5_9PLEO|nr:hypothetical protein P154DRAFT_583007 [Amniculicola lignicola CBS 123094]
MAWQRAKNTCTSTSTRRITIGSAERLPQSQSGPGPPQSEMLPSLLATASDAARYQTRLQLSNQALRGRSLTSLALRWRRCGPRGLGIAFSLRDGRPLRADPWPSVASSNPAHLPLPQSVLIATPLLLPCSLPANCEQNCPSSDDRQLLALRKSRAPQTFAIFAASRGRDHFADRQTATRSRFVLHAQSTWSAGRPWQLNNKATRSNRDVIAHALQQVDAAGQNPTSLLNGCAGLRSPSSQTAPALSRLPPCPDSRLQSSLTTSFK